MDWNVQHLLQIYFLLLFQISPCLLQNEVLLLDTVSSSGSSPLNWSKTPDVANIDSTKGWTDSTFNLNYPTRNSSMRSFSVIQACAISSTNVDNWLFVPYINIKDIPTIHVQINFTMRDCTEHNKPAALGQCLETFQLYYAPSSSPSIPEIKKFKLIKPVFAASQKWKTKIQFKKNRRKFINSETRTIGDNYTPLNAATGVHFAIRDTGACIMVVSVKIYYKRCLNKTRSLAHFPETIASSGFRETRGRCVHGAQLATADYPTAVCLPSGEWRITGTSSNIQRCQCAPGFQLSFSYKESCEKCPANTYKSEIGRSRCQPCPSNSESSGDKICHCKRGYFRASGEKALDGCTQPPSKIRDLEVLEIGSTSISLNWTRPAYDGGRPGDLVYRIECGSCFNDKRRSVVQKDTKVKITDLEPKKMYSISVIAQNGVIQDSGTVKAATVNVTTSDATPKAVQIERIEVKTSMRELTVKWKRPSSSHVEKYELSMSPVSNSRVKTIRFTKDLFITVHVNDPNAEYAIKVRAKSSIDWGEYGDAEYVTPRRLYEISRPQPVESDSSAAVGMAIAGAFICTVIILFAFIFVFIKCRGGSGVIGGGFGSFGHKNPATSADNEFDEMPYNPTLPFAVTQLVAKKPKQYIDPHMYEDPSDAVKEFAREIPVQFITIETVIGGGEFGNVCKGKLSYPAATHPQLIPSTLQRTSSAQMNGTNFGGEGEASEVQVDVAIKTLKPDASEKNRMDFLTEASIMGQFNHINVIFLQGVVTKSSPVMIVTEYMENGSLDAYLRGHDHQLTLLQLVGILRGISSGMQYLSDMAYVHRDLAARNILVDANLTCKVSDFGLSRHLRASPGQQSANPSDGAYTTKGGKIPVRWTAPEAIAYRKFTSASDCWSYGVLVWEVVSYGEHPYWDWTNQAVIQAVDRGYRLPPPMECPGPLYELMLNCWEKERTARPKFAQIVRLLDKLIRNPEQLSVIEPPRAPLVPLNVNPFMSIAEWLSSFGMEKYTDNFNRFSYTSLYQIIHLSSEDLAHMGVLPIGHQRIIAQNILLLNSCQLTGTFNPKLESFLV